MSEEEKLFDFKEMKVFFKKYIEPFLAILVVALLLATSVGLYKDNKLKEKINENCGWTDEEYRCYCQKNTVLEIEDSINGFDELPSIGLENIQNNKD